MRAPISPKNTKAVVQAKKATIEWEIAEDDREWLVAQSGSLAAPTPARGWGRRWWVASAVVLVCLLAAGSWLWYQAHVGLSEIEGELQAAVEIDQWQAEEQDGTIAKQSGVIQDITAKEPRAAVSRVEVLDLGEEWAIVRIITRQGDLAYRQTRLYRRGASGWYIATPSVEVWGAPRTLETTYFTFHYFAHDQEAVAEAAGKLDALYPDLIASYPLDPTGEGKYQIWVSPEVLHQRTLNTPSGTTLEITSPAHSLAPVTIREGDILAQAILLELVGVLATQSAEYLLRAGSHDPQERAQVYALLEGLKLWQLWSSDLPLARLHKPTIQWLYSEVQGERVLPAYDGQLCPLHQLWSAAPHAVQIPLFCGDPQRMDRFEVGRYYSPAPPRSLAEVDLYTATTPDEPYGARVEAEPVGLATIFDYVAATYGRQSLAVLIANGTSLSSWETLIPATFGVSTSDFEKGWQAHLRDAYGIPAF